MPEESRSRIFIAAVVCLLAHLQVPDASATVIPLADGPAVQIVSVKGQLVAGKWVETVVLANKGAVAAMGFSVTSWPYNDKDPVDPDEPKGPRKDSATQAQPGAQFSQVKTVDIPAGQQVVVTFTYEGADAKKWRSAYVDVYRGAPRSQNFVTGTARQYAFLQLPPGPGGVVAVDFQRPYPAALIGSDIFDPASFSVSITESSLPSGWSLLSLSPLSYTLSADGTAPFSVFMEATFATASTIEAGDIAFVAYAATLEGTELSWRGDLGVVAVPEPSVLAWLGGCALWLVGFHIRSVRGANRLPPPPGA